MPELVESLTGKPVILLIEPDEGEVSLVQRAFEHAGLEVELRVAGVPEDVPGLLSRPPDETDGRRPQLILLSVDGPEGRSASLLRALKSEPDLRRIPVVALTRLENEGIVRAMYDLRINAYVVKASEFEAFVAQLREMLRYWFQTISLPPR